MNNPEIDHNIEVEVSNDGYRCRANNLEIFITREQYRDPKNVEEAALALGVSTKALEQAVENALAKTEPFGKKTPKPLVKQALSVPDRGWLVKNLIPQGSLVILAGKAGVGKSFLSLKLSGDVASCQPFLGSFETHGSNVLVIDEENDLATYKERILMLSLESCINIDALVMEGFKLDNEDDIELLEDILKWRHYALIVLDCWTDLLSKIDDNKAVVVNTILQTLKRIALEYDTTILLIHHLRKNAPYVFEERDELRGSSVLLNKPDVVMLMEQDPTDPNTKVLKVVKNRFGASRAYRLLFQEKNGRFEIKLLGEAVIAEHQVEKCAAVLVDFLSAAGPGEYRRKQLDDAAPGYGRGTIARAILILTNRGVLEKVKRGVYRYKGQQTGDKTETEESPKLPIPKENGEKTGNKPEAGEAQKLPDPSGKGKQVEATPTDMRLSNCPIDHIYNIVDNGQSKEGSPRYVCPDCFTVLKEQNLVLNQAEAPPGICEFCGKHSSTRLKVYEKHGTTIPNQEDRGPPGSQAPERPVSREQPLTRDFSGNDLREAPGSRGAGETMPDENTRSESPGSSKHDAGQCEDPRSPMEEHASEKLSPRWACQRCFTNLKENNMVRMYAQDPGGLCDYCGEYSEIRFKVWEKDISVGFN